jgi:hypothetical protein
MIVLDDICEKCNRICNATTFRRNFKNWTSGNNGIDEFIQESQLLTHDNAIKALEWISYNRFYNVKYIEKIGGYKANWIDGRIYKWDSENQDWKRYNKNMPVTLKSLNNSSNIVLEYMNKV